MKGTKTITAALLSLVLGITGCGAKQATSDNQQIQDNKQSNDLAMRKTYTDEEIRTNGWEKATFGGGCFWCTEAIFEEVKGVKSVVSGYAGGKMEKPTYEAVCTDTTGHAECVQVVFDPKECAFATILDVHMKTHDPTTLNRQGNDVGIQYRSVVFYENDAQKTATEDYINKLNASGYYSDKIVTEVVPLTTFWPAETYHQDYFAKNPDQPYCVYVVAKKVDKFEHLFPELIEK
ncbi:MAG TPA: peptide-methionine (S)-S-oxide reductase MsrA [Chitinophagales bacterium]|nr:peptide-methionine (S)-S-oxide reductase MsrA [Chitinophagales bacterium]